MNDNNKKVIIIGSGPAGLTSAIYAARGGLEPVVISGNEPGGQLMFTTDVENFPGFPEVIKGPDLMEGMRKQAERFGTKFIDSAVSSVNFLSKPFKVSLGDEHTETAEAVIIATGSSAMWLGLESERRLNGFFFKGKDAVVVGGGEVAIEEALLLSKLTNTVKVIHRRDELRAAIIMQQRAFNNTKISFVWNTVVDEILGENKVEGIRVRNLVSKELSEIRCDAVFMAIGHKPNTDVFRGRLELDNKGYIKKYEESKTNIDGIFVAGDVYDYTYRQAVTAAGSGCKAAIDVIKYLESKEENE
jgi:thioredoxin reductase (NADPH)